MKIFLIWVNDENFYRLLPQDLGGSKPGDARVKVMGFPPLGIETLAPVLRQHGHQVRMFDTCHPEMKEPDIAQALRDDPPDVVALSFLSTTTYPGVKSMAQRGQGRDAGCAGHLRRRFCHDEPGTDSEGLSLH